MKYVVILGDGMADEPICELNNKTPLQYANKPNMDFIAKNGIMGLVNTVPENMSPGSDIANLSVMGYSPQKYYTGRSPIEAMSMGLNLQDTDVALRCNFVTLSQKEDYYEKKILDYCADEITTDEAQILIDTINKNLGNNEFSFYTGTSYRHCTVWKQGEVELNLTPPHDITGKKITTHLPSTTKALKLLDLMQKSHDILKDHPVNKKRVEEGLHPANSIWLWGEGRKPTLPLFKDLYGVSGSMISAVDLLKGIAICAGLDVINVKGATGNIHTNFEGKAHAALKELQSGKDFVFIHIEAPDECGHRGEIHNKVKSIELIDQKILKFMLENMGQFDDYKILLLPDHPTPLSLRTHTRSPVPYVIYHKNSLQYSGLNNYDELSAEKTSNFINVGSNLMSIFLG
jgi:2,3-bisphosphoglycerate-independent phosphoglycerate mutase